MPGCFLPEVKTLKMSRSGASQGAKSGMPERRKGKPAWDFRVPYFHSGKPTPVFRVPYFHSGKPAWDFRVPFFHSGKPARNFRVPYFRSGKPARDFRVPFWRSGKLARDFREPFRVQASLCGISANLFGIQATQRGITASLFGVQASLHGISACLVFISASLRGMTACPSAHEASPGSGDATGPPETAPVSGSLVSQAGSDPFQSPMLEPDSPSPAFSRGQRRSSNSVPLSPALQAERRRSDSVETQAHPPLEARKPSR